tara:strand:+ start:1158 stop:1445 length:288 start_codon:yes stop_codon:yes gene_type:complete
MKRYGMTSLKEKKSTRKKSKHTHQATTLYEKIPHAEGDIWVVTQYGDRLDLIAHQFYGDKALWWYIAKANNLKLNKVPIGTVLRIPESTAFAKGR